MSWFGYLSIVASRKFWESTLKSGGCRQERTVGPMMEDQLLSGVQVEVDDLRSFRI